ncbi:uncharacterized protein BP5553_07591 [Venustampulla echinocandica]|uniref:Vacuolar ATPase assembly protein VMA22 n=1 Tax=Venustampulla echinocandica TaxID=2656787 RepID=A0A370TH03_9HELO|nr:uncharacterized protein BP5553_07591 [Venustampulla echinocandica]RDL34463.1 hypothetical protein BP5553_07591 [Venustampulla echinocandica]
MSADAVPNTTIRLSDEIDRLLEQYLQLLDQYTTLRSSLSKTQSTIYQSIARANFSAERGVRYGADFYDERIQATRVCRVTVPGHINSENPTGTRTSAAAYTVVSTACLEDDAASGMAKKDDIDPNEKENARELDEEKDNGQAETKPRSRDPIRIFGVFVPPALKLAQSEAVKMIENIIPKLVSVDAEMKEVEIKIGRARKHRLKEQAKLEGLDRDAASVG